MEISNRHLASMSEDGRYRPLVEAITDYAIYMLDPTGVITSWNPGAQRFKGYAPHEIIGQHFSRFYGEEDRKSGLPGRALKIAAQEGKFEAEGWRYRKDGTRFWAYVIIDPIRDESGKIIGFAKITRDLTERRAAEQHLRRSEEQFRLLVQGVTDYALYMLDADGNIASWNAGAERIKGYKADEIIGKHFSSFYTPEDRENNEPKKALETARREGRFEREAWRQRKDGSRFFAHVIIDPIRDDTGEIVGFAKITRDITERREAQIKLEQAREALMQSQKMEAIGQLTGGIAHDFNNLLMAVMGSLELMRKRLPDDPRLLSLLDNAVKGAQRGATLTKRMLAFARRQDLKKEAVDVRSLVGGMTELLERSLGPTVDIVTRFGPKLRFVQADANQLEMVILNLAVNARDAMPGGGQIVIEGDEVMLMPGNEHGLKPGSYLSFKLTDNGTGMDEATLSRALEPFFTTKGLGKGTGLGLSMVHGITEQFGGRFSLTSQKGKGTTAELLLPIAEARLRAVANDQPDQAKAVVGQSLVILTVDDDSLVLTNTIAMLEDLGHIGIGAMNAMQALDTLQEKYVDLVITDHAMPNMTGLQLAEVIGKKWPDLPVVLATGYAELPAGERTTLPKLEKPFTQAELAKQVMTAMERRPARPKLA